MKERRTIKKVLFLLILITLMISLTLFSILYHQPTSSELSTKTETISLESGGEITTTSYTNQSGQVTTPSDKRYAVTRETKDEDGKRILTEYLDEQLRPVMLNAGYAAISRRYEDGLVTVITYLDAEKNPAMIHNGYDSIHRTYNDRRLAETDTYWIGNNQVARKQGYASYHRTYNTKKQLVILEYRDMNGNLTLNSSGYARAERAYNEAGKISEVRYYGTDGEPIRLPAGQYGYRRSYDGQGRTVETVYLGKDGEVANQNRGYARVTTSYTEKGTKKQYYNSEGQPVTIGKNQYGTLRTEDQSIYLDEEGQEMQRMDNILMTSPMLVLGCGTLLVLIALFAKGRIRSAFLICYLGFILYMTMAWREATDSRGVFELFRSYSRFLSNGRTRQQIINNIWLFIPFGTVLMSLLRDKTGKGILKSGILCVLICMALSGTIEFIQWIWKIGLCELDDIVSNTLGGSMGALICMLTGSFTHVAPKYGD